MKRTDFSYDLPPHLIAQEPRVRGLSRMMVVTPSLPIEHASFASFPSRLAPGDLLVINDTRVIPARLFAEPKGNMKRPIELLLTRRREGALWDAWCRPARRVSVGDHLKLSPSLTAEVMGKTTEGIVVQFHGDESEIERIGLPPLPPYIARETPRAGDREAYQTVYANAPGAIAAPTAGLHFTPAILAEIRDRGVEIVRITLHVGIGTFMPVKADDIADHRMPVERYEITEEAAAALNRATVEGRTIVAVGTTSVRTLESAVRAGGGRFVAGASDTSIFITPGFEFQVTGRLLTNFHLPESTLLMLVSAFAGVETIREAYRAAIADGYFFYSYGDCMLLTRS